MTDIIHDCSNIPGLMDGIYTKETKENYYCINEYFTKSNEKYYIIKYDKDSLTPYNTNVYGYLRSIIMSQNGKILAFSPQKAISSEAFIKKYPNIDENIYAEEFVEGTMINLFYNYDIGISGCWQIATRNTVGGDTRYFTSKTFNTMFNEACYQNNFNYNTLNPEFCYSFVLQHPDNRIVVPVKSPQLYLVGVYSILQTENTLKIHEHNMENVKLHGLWNFSTIKFPQKYSFSSYSELIEKYASANTDYSIMGVVIKNSLTGERMKIRNPIYEEVKHLRGNQPKLLYQYLTLRKEGKVPLLLKFYPEFKDQLSQFRDNIHMFTRTLHQNYIDCYVKKLKPLNQYSQQFKTHMYKLHELYRINLMPNKLFVNSTTVKNYVNDMHPTLLMYSLNYNLRKRNIDNITLSIV
jgi:hypothetical protein